MAKRLSEDLSRMGLARELFWQNVIRELLTSLSVVALNRADGGNGSESGQGEDQQDLFDGRLAVITRDGERIAIADVFPVFACGVSTTAAAQSLSVAVECTVFQIRTPEGEVYTLPLHEIRAFHSLSEELVRRLKKAVEAQRGDTEGIDRPFGFAAFTSLARGAKSGEEPAI